MFLFSKNKSRFHSRRQPFRKIIIAEEELDGIGIDDIANLEDSPRFVFIDEKCENLIVARMAENLLEIETKKNSGV